MRLHLVLASLLLALVSAGAQEAPTAKLLRSIRIEGGDEDDQRFAGAALGLTTNKVVDDGAFQQALAAVRLVDRYQSVEGALGADGIARIRLAPLHPLASWTMEGEAPRDLPWSRILTGLRRGQRVGPMRLKVLLEEGERRLREAGFPKASLVATQEQGGAILRIRLMLGAPTLIREVRIEGDPRPYDRASLLKVAGLEPGRTRWTPTVLREAQRSLRLRLVTDDRLEGNARLIPVAGEDGVLVMQVQPGPKVKLKAEGMSWFGFLWNQPRLSELVPLARAERYSPSILEEGDGRISAYYRDQGYPEVKVTHARVVTGGTADRPESVLISYRVEPGPRRVLGQVSFEGNREISEAELKRAAQLPERFLFLPPHAKAEVVKALEDRVTALYLQRGFADVRVRRKVETTASGRVQVHLIIWEGQQRFLDALTLAFPTGIALPREAMARSLVLAMGEFPEAIPGASGRFRSNRPQLRGVVGTLEQTAEGARLAFHPAIPMVRNDLALVVVDLRQKLSSAGAVNPQVLLSLEEGADPPTVTIQIPPQPLDATRRLVVQGSDRTRAKAVLREMETPAGMPLNPAKLDAGQIRLGNLGAFQRVDLLSLKELPGQDVQPWQRGDLALRLLERSPWVFSESFGYDRTQGYHFGLSAQQLNVGGMGRTIDYGLRAGDQTLGSKALQRAFPTGDIKRSVDNYSIGYTDPWFLPSVLDSLLAERTRFHLEGAYIEEAQASYFARRRRFMPSLEWKVGPVQSVQFGYRYERVEVAANTNSSGLPLLSDADLFLIARTPGRSVISAPFLQVAVDRRDRPYDPTSGTFFLGRLEFANQVFGTSANSSFVKLDLRHQWNWPVGFHAEKGVLMANLRVGLARPTAQSAQDLPLSERFYGGGSFTVRGVEPDMLGDIQRVDASGNPLAQPIPLGGQALAVINLEYRFPLFGWSSVWMEVFVDSGQVYRSLKPEAGAISPFPPLRTTLGTGLILKLGIPLKLEYAADWKRLLGRPRTENEQDTQLKSLLISAGFQF